MSFKLVVTYIFGALLVAAQAVRPHIGYPMQNFGVGRIMNGENAKKGEFPHQISLFWGAPPQAPNQHICGGSIIDSNWILTAAHCVSPAKPSGTYFVKAGKHNILEVEEGEQIAEIEKFIVHKDFIGFEGGVGPYDVALLKLKTPLKMNESVKPMNMPTAGTKPTGITVLSGWGSVDAWGNNGAVILQKAILPIIDIGTCQAKFDAVINIGPMPVVHSTNICTAFNDNDATGCMGDSGSPLMQKNPSGALEVVGMLSWLAIPCGYKGAPTVYTNVADYVDWIHNNMRNN